MDRMSEKVYSHKSLKEISAVRAFKKLVYQNSKYLSTQPSLRTYAIKIKPSYTRAFSKMFTATFLIVPIS